MTKFTELQRGYDLQNKCYTITLKINGIIFETTAFSETERDNIYRELEKEIQPIKLSYFFY